MSKFQYTYSDPIPSTDACASGTPYGTYNSDNIFCSESVNVCKWVSRRLGHPVMQLEFNSGSVYAMFEESISEYSSFINNYNTKNWFWEQYGSQSTGSNFATASTDVNEVTHPRLGTTYMLSDQYGESIGVGGSVSIQSGSITLTGSQQVYDLQKIYSQSLASSGNENKRIVIQRVFNYGPAAITRFYDPLWDLMIKE